MSTLGNLKQRKTKPKPSFIEPTETSQVTETNPKQAPIETNEIPGTNLIRYPTAIFFDIYLIFRHVI